MHRLCAQFLGYDNSFQPHKQASNHFAPNMPPKIKGEIEWLLKVKFIRTTKYVKWLTNIVLVMKKNMKLWICIKFKHLNDAMPRDEYPMPMANMLVDSALECIVVSFINRNVGYNQVYIIKNDVAKVAFRYLSALGTYE